MTALTEIFSHPLRFRRRTGELDRVKKESRRLRAAGELMDSVRALCEKEQQNTIRRVRTNKGADKNNPDNITRAKFWTYTYENDGEKESLAVEVQDDSDDVGNSILTTYHILRVAGSVMSVSGTKAIFDSKKIYWKGSMQPFAYRLKGLTESLYPKRKR